MELHDSHAVGNGTVQSAKYFGNKDSEAVYVATVNGHTAHGKAVREAIEDANEKAGLADPSAVVSEIKASGRITRLQYRQLTGACREGIRHWCKANGIGDDVESIPLADAMRLVNGHCGFNRFAELLSTEV
jgi:hypothetical protein